MAESNITNPRLRRGRQQNAPVQGGAVFQVQGTENANLKPNPDPVTQAFTSMNVTDPRSSFWALPREVGQGVSRLGGKLEQGISNIPQEGLIPQVGAGADFVLEQSAELSKPISHFLFGPPAEEEEGDQELSEPAQAFRGASGLGGGGSSASVTASGSSEGGAQQTRTQNVRLPPGDEVISNPNVPALNDEQLDQFIGRLEEARPEDFEAQDPRLSNVLAQAGRALAEAGRAPTVGQALLAAGTGASGAVAERQQQNEELARQREEAQRQFDASLAEAAFGGQQTVNESQRAAQEVINQREMQQAELEARRDEAINQLSGVEVQGDNIVVRSVEGFNDDGTASVKTEVFNPEEQRGMMDKIALGEDLADMELPEIGGTEGQKFLQLARSPEQRLQLTGAMQLAEGTLPPEQIQMEGGRELDQQIKQRARARIAESMGLEPTATESEIRTQFKATSDASYEDVYEEELMREWNRTMSNNPAIRVGVLQGMGFGNQ